MVGFWDGEVGSWVGGTVGGEYGEFGVDVGAVGVLCWIEEESERMRRRINGEYKRRKVI